MPRHIWHKISRHFCLDGNATAHLAQNLWLLLLRRQCHGTPGTQFVTTFAETTLLVHTGHQFSGHFCLVASATAHLAQNLWPLWLRRQRHGTPGTKSLATLAQAPVPRHTWHKIGGHFCLDASATAHLAQNLWPLLLRRQCHGTPGTKSLATFAESPVPRHTWHKISGHFCLRRQCHGTPCTKILPTVA